MGHGNDRTLILLQMGLKPLDTLGIEVVGRLVEQKHIRLLEKKTAQCHATPFATAQCSDFRIRRRALERIHSPFQLRVDFPASAMFDFFGQFTLPFDELVHLVIAHRLAELQVHGLILLEHVHNLLNAPLNHFQDRFLRIHLWFLLQIAHTVPRSPDHLSLITLFNAGNDFHQCGFTRAVQTDDTYFRSIEE